MCGDKECNQERILSPDNFNDNGCTACGKPLRALNLTIADRNIKCINYKLGSFKCLNPECLETWTDGMSRVRQDNGGCPNCSDNAPLTAWKYHEVASINRGKWLGETLPGSKGKTKWQCEYLHTFDKDIQGARTWHCPKCNSPYFKLMNEVNKYTGSIILTPAAEIIKQSIVINIKCPHDHWQVNVKSIIGSTKSWKCKLCKTDYKARLANE